MPECLIGIVDFDILQLQVFHLPEKFRTVDDTVFHHHVVAVPNGRPAVGGEVAACDEAAVDVPPRVLAKELAVVTLDVVTAFDA